MTSSLAIIATLKKEKLEAHLTSIIEKTEEAVEYAKFALKIATIITSTLRAIQPYTGALCTISSTLAYETVTLAEKKISLAKEYQIKLADKLKESILISQDKKTPILVEDATVALELVLYTKQIHKIAKASQIAISIALEKASFASRLATAIGKKEYANFMIQLAPDATEEVKRMITKEHIEFCAPLNLIQAVAEDKANIAKEYADKFEVCTRKMKKAAHLTATAIGI